MPRFLWIGWLVSLAFGAFCGRRALANLSAEGEDAGPRVLFYGAWAKRRWFTQKGWRCYQLAVWGTLMLWITIILLTADLWNS